MITQADRVFAKAKGISNMQAHIERYLLKNPQQRMEYHQKTCSARFQVYWVPLEPTMTGCPNCEQFFADDGEA